MDRGIVKVNIGTRGNQALTGGVRATLAEQPDQTDPREYLAPGRLAVTAGVTRLLNVLAGPVRSS